jgi:opacity protein-like surface antigen
MKATAALCLTLLVLIPAANAQDHHAMIDSKWWVTAGSFLASTKFEASAKGGIQGLNREFDFEESLGFDDSPELFQGELGWQFSDNWSLTAQYFRSTRNARKTLDESIEWEGNTYEIGAFVAAETKLEVTRFFVARRFHDSGPHSLRVGAGLHWLSMRASIAGEATFEDQTTGFRRAASAAEVPIPNIGVWYRYSPSDKWIFNARVDWLSASIDNYSGEIWNVSGGVSYELFEHFSIGANYQLFRLGGTLTEDNWRGEVTTTYTGPYLFLAGYW